MIGKHLSHYLIEAELGRGGMGIVYLATDTKLDRQVAIKVLPSAALASDDDRARFYREAKAAAALTHPNIAIIHAVDEAVPEGAPHGTEASPFIAMEFIDGETLEDRIKKGPMKLGDAVRVASEIAGALKLAHENEIVHRDIKSANVMLTRDGVAKVLDFGLAQTSASTKLTRLGSTLGTVAYMSPEQARGEPVDARTDIWSLGAVLYEMIAGRPAFGGDYEQALIYSILNTSPEPLTAVRTGVPMELERIVEKLLAKEADRRYQTLADLRVDLRGVDVSGSGVSALNESQSSAAPTTAVHSTTHTAIASTAVVESVRPTTLKKVPVLLALIATLVAGLVIGKWVLQGDTAQVNEPVIRRLSMSFPGFTSPRIPAISPDGRYLVFTALDSVGITRTVIYDFEKGEYSASYLTDGFIMPTFSPDGRWLALSGIGSGVRTLLLPDGNPRVLTTNGEWAHWESNESLLFRQDLQLYRISATGGPATLVVTADTSLGMDRFWPMSTLPEQGIAFIAGAGDGITNRHIYVLDLKTNKYKRIIEKAHAARYLDSGHLIYMQGGGLSGQIVVQAFDLETLEPYGLAAPLDIDPLSWQDWTVGNDGTVIYGPGAASNSNEYVWLDSSGNSISKLSLPAGLYRNAAISGKGDRLLVVRSAGEFYSDDIYILDLETSRTPIRLTSNVTVSSAAWSSDGADIYYSMQDPSGRSSKINKLSADGSGRQVLVRALEDMAAEDLAISPDGASLVFYDNLTSDLYRLNIADSTVTRITDTPNLREANPVISPDGSFVAFTDRGQPRHLYVKELNGSGEWDIFGTRGYWHPAWSDDGQYLYYSTSGGLLMRQRVALEGTFSTIEGPVSVANIVRPGAEFALHPDGDRILVNSTIKEGENLILNFIFNYQTEATKVAPVR